MTGPVLSQFNADAVRMDFDKLGLTVVAKAPKWDGQLYSRETKKYMQIPYAQWKTRFNLGLSHRLEESVERKVKTVKTGKKAKIVGHKTEEISVTVDEPHHPRQRLDVWVTREIIPPVQFGVLLATFMQIPADKGMPLRVVQYKADGRKVVLFDTEKTQETAIAASEFVMPSGLQLVTDEMAVLFGDVGADDTRATPEAGSNGSKKAALSPAIAPAMIPVKDASKHGRGP